MRILSGIPAFILVAALAMGGTGCGDSGDTQAPVNNNLKYKKGATYTYNMYQRDSANTRMNNSKNVVIWTVLKVDTTYQSKTGVTVIEEAVYDGAGTTVQRHDTLYMQTSAGDGGQVYQYDVVGEFFARVPVAANYRDSVAKQWARIGDLKTTSPTTWVTASAVTVNNIMLDFGGTSFTLTATVKMDARHQGVVASTTPAGSYPKTYRTDHAIGITANSVAPPLPLLNDSLSARYDFDIAAGLTRKSLDSKTFVVAGTPQQVPGFEMELVAYTVPQ